MSILSFSKDSVNATSFTLSHSHVDETMIGLAWSNDRLWALLIDRGSNRWRDGQRQTQFSVSEVMRQTGVSGNEIILRKPGSIGPGSMHHRYNASAWQPMAGNRTHVAVLTSDNTLALFDAKREEWVASLPLPQGHMVAHLSGSEDYFVMTMRISATERVYEHFVLRTADPGNIRFEKLHLPRKANSMVCVAAENHNILFKKSRSIDNSIYIAQLFSSNDLDFEPRSISVGNWVASTWFGVCGNALIGGYVSDFDMRFRWFWSLDGVKWNKCVHHWGFPVITCRLPAAWQ
jgi:hypothetical protein